MTATRSAAGEAAHAPNQYLELDDRRLSYRRIGAGTAILLCNRFRGTLDSWDPAFLDGLAARGFDVIWFDYSGIGLSTGERTYDPVALAKNAGDMITGLGLEDLVLGGWSVGGIAAQITLPSQLDRVSHLVLIGTTPPGRLVKLPEPLFFELAARENDAEDHVALFFEPASAHSRELARRSAERTTLRLTDRSPDVPAKWAASTMTSGPQEVMFPADAILEFERNAPVPILHIGGDHDIIFPVENWYALNGQLPTLQLLTFPQSGHGPQQQHPLASAEYIATFVATTGPLSPRDDSM